MFCIKYLCTNKENPSERVGSPLELLWQLNSPLLPFTDDRGISPLASGDSGRRPKTLRAFEKARPKLSLRGLCEHSALTNQNLEHIKFVTYPRKFRKDIQHKEKETQKSAYMALFSFYGGIYRLLCVRASCIINVYQKKGGVK